MALLTLLIAGCSKPEEVISRRVAQANQNLDAGRLDEAIKALEELNRAYIDQPTVLEALGFAYARAGQHTAAATSFLRAADVDPQTSASLRRFAADSFLLAGETDRAEEQYHLYNDEFPADFRGREKIGEIEEKNGDLARALDAYLECYRLRPSGEYAWRVGGVFKRLNNTPQTKSWLETTIKHGEAHVEDALLGLLELELNARDFTAASRTIDQLDRIYPGVLDQSPLAGARAELAAWREQQKALESARATQEHAAREIEQERKRREAELQALTAQPSPSATPPPTARTPAPGTPAATPTTSAPRPAPVVAAPAPVVVTTPVAPPPVEATPPPITAAANPPAAETPAPGPAPEPEPEGALASPMSADLLAALELKDRGNHDGAAAALWSIIANDDQRVDAWMELGNLYHEMKNYGDAESCLLEAARRAPDRVDVTIGLLEIVRESQPQDVYFARIEGARRKFPGNADLAYFFAHELAALDGARTRAVIAYEDFLLLAAPDDRRRAEATTYLARVRGY